MRNKSQSAPFEHRLSAMVVLALALTACADRGSPGARSADDPSMESFGADGPRRVELDPCAVLTPEEVATQLARGLQPSDQQNWSTTEFDVTPKEVEWGDARRCEYAFQSRATAGGGPIWHSDFNVMVMDADAMYLPEQSRLPVNGAGPEIFRARGEKAYYVTKGKYAATLTSFPGNQNPAAGDEDATRVALLHQIASRLP